jgi:hypothetical protein
MKKLRIIDYVFIIAIIGLTLFGFTHQNKGIRSRAITPVNVGSNPNDHAGDPLRTAFGKVNQAIDMINNGIDASTIYQPMADSVNGKYATKNYVLLHTNGGTSWINSLDVRADPPALGNIYIASGDKKIHYFVNGYWKRVQDKDSIATESYSAELIVNGTFNSNITSWTTAGTWVWESDGIGGGRMRHSTSGDDDMASQSILTVGHTYHIVITIGGRTVGMVNVTCGNNYTYTRNAYENTTYTFDLYCYGDGLMRFEGSFDFDGYIDNVSVTEVL